MSAASRVRARRATAPFRGARCAELGLASLLALASAPRAAGRAEVGVDPMALTVRNDDAGEQFGVMFATPIAAGDLNGDGAADVALGVEMSGLDGVGRFRCGEIFVLFGPFSGDVVDLATDAPDVRIVGRAADDRLGSTVVVADLDGDGKDDLVACSSGHDEPGADQAGLVDVFFGPLSGGTIDLATSASDHEIHGILGGRFGESGVAVGDVSGDGVLDLVLGANDYRRPRPPLPAEATGAVLVLYGPITRAPPRFLATRPAEWTVIGEQDGDLFGAEVAVGDISGDGVGDLVVGAVASDGPGDTRLNCGEILGLFGGRPSGTVTDISRTAPDVRIIGPTADQLGWAVGAGDVNHDGSDDIVATSRLTDGPDGVRTDAGSARAFMGPFSPGTTLDVAAGDADVTIHGRNDGASLGAGLDLAPAVGGAHVAVGSPAAQERSGRQGAAYVFQRLGDRPVLDLATDVADFTLLNGTVGGQFGTAVLLHDTDGDGVPDVLAADPYAPCAAGPECGVLHVFVRPPGCATPPPEPGDASLAVGRAGIDVVLSFPAPADPDTVTRIYRGALTGLHATGAWDHGSVACSVTAATWTDDGEAGVGRPDAYYLISSACDGGSSWRETGLGAGTRGPRPTAGSLGTAACP